MPLTLLNGARVPQGTDLSAPQTDMDLLGRSVRTVLTADSHAQAVAMVEQARTQLGWAATTATPVLVHRTDTGCLHRWDGARWAVLAADEDVSSMVSSHSGWVLDVKHARRNGRLVSVQFSITNQAGSAGFAQWTEYQIGRLAEGLRPASNTSAPVVFKPPFAVHARAGDGALILQSSEATTWGSGAWITTLSFTTP